MTTMSDLLILAQGKIKRLPNGNYHESGVYSFYSAVQILKQINAKYPDVPRPKSAVMNHVNREKSKFPPIAAGLNSPLKYYDESMNAHFIDNYYNEAVIFTEFKMFSLVRENGYFIHSCDKKISKEEKILFIRKCLVDKFPVLIPITQIFPYQSLVPIWVLITGWKNNKFYVTYPENSNNPVWINAYYILEMNLRCFYQVVPEIPRKERNFKNSLQRDKDLKSAKSFGQIDFYSYNNYHHWMRHEFITKQYFVHAYSYPIRPIIINNQNPISEQVKSYNLVNVIMAVTDGSMDLCAGIDEEHEPINVPRGRIKKSNQGGKLSVQPRADLQVAVNEESIISRWIPKFFKRF